MFFIIYIFSNTGIGKTAKYFLYNGEKVDENLTIEQTICKSDKLANKMDILVNNDEENDKESEDEIIIQIIYKNKTTIIVSS